MLRAQLNKKKGGRGGSLCKKNAGVTLPGNDAIRVEPVLE